MSITGLSICKESGRSAPGTNFLRLPSGGFMGLKPKQQPHALPELPPDDYRLGHVWDAVKAAISRNIFGGFLGLFFSVYFVGTRRFLLHNVKWLCKRLLRNYPKIPLFTRYSLPFLNLFSGIINKGLSNKSIVCKGPPPDALYRAGNDNAGTLPACLDKAVAQALLTKGVIPNAGNRQVLYARWYPIYPCRFPCTP